MLQMATKPQRAAEDVYLGEVLSSPEKISRLADEIRDLPVNQRSFAWRTMRRLLGWASNILPARMRYLADWVVPKNLEQGSGID